MTKKKKVSISFIEFVKKDFAKNEPSSLDEMNERLKILQDKFNEIGLEEFYGVSPRQMSDILDRKFNLSFGFITLDRKKNINFLLQVPLIQQALFVLYKVRECGSLKLTQKGNFSRVFVKEMFEKFFSEDKLSVEPNNEDDCPEITRVRFLLEESNYIINKNNKCILSKKGESLIEESNYWDLYQDLFEGFVDIWEWGYMDRYPDYDMLQKSAAFNFYLLFKKASNWTSDHILAKEYLNAFPSVLVNQGEPIMRTPEEQFENCFSVRFLERVCVPLGILDVKFKGRSFFDRKAHFKASKILNECLKFNLNF